MVAYTACCNIFDKAWVLRTADFFSVGLLLKTLFNPFRQISAAPVGGDLSVQLSAFFGQDVREYWRGGALHGDNYWDIDDVTDFCDDCRVIIKWRCR